MKRRGVWLSESLLVVLGFLFLVPSLAWTQQSSVENPGSLRWFGLLTEDAAVARAFYADLFGWQIQRSSSASHIILHEGRPIGGITQIGRSTPEIDESSWLVGIEVSDLEASVAAARRLGAQVLRDVTNSEGFAQWAVIEDPQGAQVLLLDPELNLGGDPEPGNWVWAELWTVDLAASSRFYAEVVGWERGDESRQEGDYPLFQSAGQPRAGLVQINPAEMEPGWAPYIGVADLPATLARAKELGGEVLLEPAEDIYEGRLAILADPTGVSFLVIQLEEEAR